MTTSISPLLQVGLFRMYNFAVSQIKHLTPKITWDFQNVVYHFSPSKWKEILGNLSRLQIIIHHQNCLNV